MARDGGVFVWEWVADQKPFPDSSGAVMGRSEKEGSGLAGSEKQSRKGSEGGSGQESDSGGVDSDSEQQRGLASLGVVSG